MKVIIRDLQERGAHKVETAAHALRLEKTSHLTLSTQIKAWLEIGQGRGCEWEGQGVNGRRRQWGRGVDVKT